MIQIPTVFITGAAGGLGRALVTEFLRQEWHVIAASRQPAEWEPHDRLSAIVLDVTRTADVDAAIANVIAEHGNITCLVNNAGITRDGSVLQLSQPEWDDVIAVNLDGAFHCARAVARHMANQRDGHVINISSFGGRAGAAGQSNYAASKAGLLGLTQSLAKELGSRNVRVNSILPGVLPTNMTARLPAERLEAFARANALGRINSLDEVARFIAFLATTTNISGQVFQLDSRIAPWT